MKSGEGGGGRPRGEGVLRCREQSMVEGWRLMLLSIKQDENWKLSAGFSNVIVTGNSRESHFVRWLFVR